MTPDEVLTYGREVDHRLREVLGDRLLGSWFVGSVALDGYRPGASDVDIAAAVATDLGADEAEAIAGRLVHSQLPGPARGLELVVYGVGDGGGPPGSEPVVLLNLDSGPEVGDLVDPGGDRTPAFWFVLDRLVAHRCGVTISGPPPADVFAEPARPEVIEAMLESVRWHRTPSAEVGDAVLNAARAWRFVETDVVGTKLDGAVWARSRTGHAEVVAAAMAAPVAFQRHEVDGFLDEVETALRRALDSAV